MYSVLKLTHILNFLDTFSVGATPQGQPKWVLYKLNY